MTWLDVAGKNPWLTLAAALGLAALIACGFWGNAILRRREEEADFDADLDADTYVLELTHDETMRDLRPEAGPGLYGEVTTDGPEVPRALPDEVAPAEAPERPERDLTPKQRRRAVHKGRIPRDVSAGRPGPDHGPGSSRGGTSPLTLNLPAPARQPSSPEVAGTAKAVGGESTERLISGILAAELDAGRWLAAEADRAREEETLRERAELDARIDEAYRVVGAGFADLEARNWLELAA